jgi:hypothetical protein
MGESQRENLRHSANASDAALRKTARIDDSAAARRRRTGVNTRSAGDTQAMARVSINVGAVAETVWEVLADTSAYADWVVGTKGVVRADAAWPQVGSSLEYELGVGPIAVGDRTVVVEAEPPRMLLLRAEFRRLGAATIRIELESQENGMTQVLMDEAPTEGVIRAIHTSLSDMALARRNRVALGRLKRLAESRA